MSWKKAVFYGGAVLLLAACADTTAPSPSAMKKLDGSANLFGSTIGLPTTTTAPSDSTTKPTNCSSIVIHVGIDGTLSVKCMPSGGLE